MVLDDSGNVYVTGESSEGVALGGINWVTIKYNTEGVLIWKKSLNWINNNTDEPFGINIDKENNIYVVGFGRVTNIERALVTIKYSSYGDSVWTKNYTSLPNRSNWGYSVSIDDSLNVYSSGYGAIQGGNEIVTLKYDKFGNEKWIRKYPTYSGDYLRPTFSELDKENNLIIVGNSDSTHSYDFVTLKYSSNGNLIWSRMYDAGNIDRANSLFIDNHSNILIAGFTFLNNYGDYLILKYSPEGDTLLNLNINGQDSSSDDEANIILSDTAGNIYVTGASQSTSFRMDFLTLKLNSNGDTIWSKRYKTQLENFAYCLSIDKNDNIFVSGEGELTLGYTGIVTVKYSQLTDIGNNEIILINSYELYNYPNPFNPSTKINFQIPEASSVELIIFDINGREIKTIVNDYKNKGEYTADFSGENYSSGVYFYSLKINGKLVKTNKMVLMR